jgi:hypothetical protein
MKLMRSSSLIVAAFVLIGLCSSEAAAQAPAVTFQQNGAQLRVEWTPVGGATFYEVFVTGSLSGGPIPVPTTFFVVTAPPGTYNVQVRGTNGATAGPLSAPVTITVGDSSPGGGGCAPVGAPAITVSTSGNVVSVAWQAVAGAAGYRLQVGNAPGATQFQTDMPASQTSVSAPVPLLGTFYVRVVSGSACGALAASAEQSFTIGAPTPGAPPPGGGTSGPRTADPTPATGVLCVAGRPDLGYCIPVNSLGYAGGIVSQAGAQFPGELFNSCAARGGNMTFVFRVLSRLRAIDTRWGLNYKRGHLGGLSEDILAFNPTNRPDNGEAQIYLFDVIGNHCPNSGGPIAGIDLAHGYNSTVNDTWLAALSGRFGPGVFGTQFGARWTIDAYLRAGFTN